MNKQRFVNVLKDTSSISQNDIDELKVLAKNHPYSQVIHGLIAKGCYNHASKDAQSFLHIAAMYATDRKVLKSLIVGQSTSGTTTPTKIAAKKMPATKAKPGNFVPLANDEAEALRAEVFRNLEALMENKKRYTENKEIEFLTTVKKGAETKKPQKTKTPKVEIAKSTKKAETKAANKASKSKSVKKTPTLNKIDLIDDFIKKEPSITQKIKEQTPSKSSQKDLSEPSAQFGDDLISENLAQILTRQGKNAKAIDIYKKLIWKFPQKKAYFATQIEALKK